MASKYWNDDKVDISSLRLSRMHQRFCVYHIIIQMAFETNSKHNVEVFEDWITLVQGFFNINFEWVVSWKPPQ